MPRVKKIARLLSCISRVSVSGDKVTRQITDSHTMRSRHHPYGLRGTILGGFGNLHARSIMCYVNEVVQWMMEGTRLEEAVIHETRHSADSQPRQGHGLP